MSKRAKRVGRRIGKLAGFAAGLAVAALLNSPAAFAESLEEALVSAYQNNPTLLAERATLRATDEGVARALSGWRPTVLIEGDAGFSQTETTSVTSGITSTTDSSLQPRSFSLSVTEPLYRAGAPAPRRSQLRIWSIRGAPNWQRPSSASCSMPLPPTWMSCAT